MFHHGGLDGIHYDYEDDDDEDEEAALPGGRLPHKMPKMPVIVAPKPVDDMMLDEEEDEEDEQASQLLRGTAQHQPAAESQQSSPESLDFQAQQALDFPTVSDAFQAHSATVFTAL
jgi:hypothetical protein